MWDSLESIYESAEKDSDCEAYIMPIPYYDKEENERLPKLRDESIYILPVLILFHMQLIRMYMCRLVLVVYMLIMSSLSLIGLKMNTKDALMNTVVKVKKIV